MGSIAAELYALISLVPTSSPPVEEEAMRFYSRIRLKCSDFQAPQDVPAISHDL